MESNRLQDDLLQEYKEERKLINEQLKLLDPLAVSLRKPAAQRLLNKWVLVFYEIICYLLFTGTIAFAVFMDKLYPFNIINTIRYQEDYVTKLGKWNVEYFYWAILGLVALIAAMFFIFARAARKFRLKNNILNLAGRHMKDIVGQHLQRKAAIDAIDQRHFMELPNSYKPSTKLNEIPNPGYGEETV